jgi:hypothetical protein
LSHKFYITLHEIKEKDFLSAATIPQSGKFSTLMSCWATHKIPKVLTLTWAVESIARLGGYLEHRKGTPIGAQVLWRGLVKFSSLWMGWQLAKQS